MNIGISEDGKMAIRPKKHLFIIQLVLLILLFLNLVSCSAIHHAKGDVYNGELLFTVAMLTSGFAPQGRIIGVYKDGIIRTNTGTKESDYYAVLSKDEYNQLFKLFDGSDFLKEKEDMLMKYGQGCGECWEIVIYYEKDKSISIPLENAMPPPAMQKFLKAVVKTCQVKFGRRFSLPNDFKEMFKDDGTRSR